MMHIPGTHRAPFRWLAAAAAAGSAVLLPVASTATATATAATTHEWASYPSAVSGLYTYNQSVATWAFNRAGSYITNGSSGNNTSNPVPDGLAATAVARFTSYATFQASVSSISKTVFGYVMYDNEDWSQTPAAEQHDPTHYMSLFAQLAHANGFKMVFEPARDLGMTDTVCPDTFGSLDKWYLNCHIARAAGQDSSAGDQLWVQNQADSGNQAAYDSLFSGAISQALAAQPGEVVLGELSSNYGTVAAGYADASSILTGTQPAAGIYFTSGSASWFSGVLTDLQNGGF